MKKEPDITWYDRVLKESKKDVDEVSQEMTESQKRAARIKAFLDLIAWSEGTSTIKESDNGYNVIVGGSLFNDYSDHPRKMVDIASYGVKSTAAGRYQILSKYWDHYSKEMGLKDFSPKNQDRYALRMFREVGCLDDIEDGRIKSAINKCASRWASFPGAGYGQREVHIDKMLSKFDEFFEEQIKRV